MSRPNQRLPSWPRRPLQSPSSPFRSLLPNASRSQALGHRCLRAASPTKPTTAALVRATELRFIKQRGAAHLRPADFALLINRARASPLGCRSTCLADCGSICSSLADVSGRYCRQGAAQKQRSKEGRNLPYGSDCCFGREGHTQHDKKNTFALHSAAAHRGALRSMREEGHAPVSCAFRTQAI